jgi:CPA2 family monovalent cation:H+ antiporter-2
MEFAILKEVVIILGLSVVIILAFQKFKMPSILGFLLTGIIAGPNGLSLIKASHEVEILSETGVIFLLFVIGIEFSIKGLIKIRNTVIWGGLLQVGGTILLTFIAANLMGLPVAQAIFMGFLISLSSTAIVLKLLSEKGQMSTPHGRIALGILIFQDIIVVPMMLITPLLAGKADNILLSVVILIVKFAVVLGLLVIMARYLVPGILKRVVKSKSRELFLLTIIVICFSTAWLTSAFGLSLALGAFFAGLIISESDYNHQATANILPFREIFISFFFVSVGMLLDVQYFFRHFWILILLTIGVILLKILIVALTVLIKKYPIRTALLSAFSLFQVGEFAFVLAMVGMSNQLLDHDVYQNFLAISILSMGITPFVFGYAPSLTDWIIRMMLPEAVRKRLLIYQRTKKQQKLEESLQLKDHIVIIGFGINGQNVSRTAHQASIPHVVIELDAEMFEKAKNEGNNVLYGDATDEHILHHAHLEDARVVVIAISDAEATKKIVVKIREINETAYVIVRTRQIKEIEETLRLGADEVIPEEFETSIGIFTKVLNHYLVPFDQIQSFANVVRASNYELLRNAKKEMKFNIHSPVHIPDMVIANIPVQQETNKIVGKTIQESGLKSTFNVTVLAIRRNKKYITQIDSELRIQTDDMLFLFGSPDNIHLVNKYLT